MNKTINKIRQDSNKINELVSKVDQAYSTRDLSEAHSIEWEDVCDDLHYNYEILYFPGGEERLKRIRENDPIAIESAIQFLLADPYHFRSGYLKEYLWHWLQHCPLSNSDKHKLEQAALLYLKRRITREFWAMCKAMARLASAKFWIDVALYTKQSNTPEAFRALYLLAHAANIQAGSILRRSIYRTVLSNKYKT